VSSLTLSIYSDTPGTGATDGVPNNAVGTLQYNAAQSTATTSSSGFQAFTTGTAITLAANTYYHLVINNPASATWGTVHDYRLEAGDAVSSYGWTIESQYPSVSFWEYHWVSNDSGATWSNSGDYADSIQFTIASNDTTAPTFENSTPSIPSTSSTSANLDTDLNEDGTVYYVVVPRGATAPTASEVKSGTASGGAAAIASGSGATSATVKNFSITGLTSSTSYDVYVAAEDDESSPNLQSAATKVEFTTGAPSLAPASQTVSAEVDTPITNTSAYTASNITGTIAYTVSPALPTGMTLDSATGVVSGTPTTEQALTTYTITGTGATSGLATATITIEVTSGFSNPLEKEDVIGTIETANNLAVNFAKTSLRSINSRFRWLRRNAESDNKSHQGVKVTFANQYIDEVVNGSSTGFGEIRLADAADFAKNYGMNQGDVMSDVGGKLIRTAAAEVREQTGVNLNPTGGTLVGNWSIWTEGQISVGKIDKTASTARQDSDSFAITVGIDRPYWDDGVIGIAATLGRDDVDIGESGSGIESDNYSVSLYSGFIPDNFTPMEVSLGFAHMQMDNTRVDGDQTLKGDRDANAIIGSVKAYAESMTRGNFTITPYGQVELSHIKLKQYSESGGTMALTYEEQRINRGMVFIGTEFDYVTNLGKGKLRPFGAIEYGYDFSGSSDADMRYVGSSTNYRMTLDKISSSRWMARIGSDYNIKDDLTASIAYEREEMIGAGHNHNIRASISATF
jgi:uncharacterized protein with beta-barrel porin domain